MKRYMTHVTSIGAALTLVGLLYAGAAAAQSQGSNASNMPQPQVSPETCAEVNWAPQLLQQYPRIPEACQEVISVNGQNWARFEGKLINVNGNGSVTSMVVDRTGKGMARMVMKPAPNQKVLLDGREYTFNQLQTGAILNLYIPEHMYEVATEPTASESEMAEIEPAPSEEVAQTQETLPATAGPLPWVLLAGGGLLLVGLGLTLRRRLGR